jgi:hypothetical protein
MRSHARFTLMPGTLIAALAVSVASAAAPVKITNCNKAVSRPKQVTLACGDANTRLNKLTWSRFGGASAKGKGTFETDTCEPNCAEGKTVTYPVMVAAAGSRSCSKGLRVYAKLTLTFKGKTPKYAKNYKHWSLRCPA